ncbi:hypothetical protein BL254_11230 [Protofrankia sp. BMG5.30]|nr:hypothetical protein BL254_11230 [Protofrankia sp. BMG5.30]
MPGSRLPKDATDLSSSGPPTPSGAVASSGGAVAGAELLATLLHPAVVAVEAFADDPDAVLFPEEAATLARSVDKRRREFTTARVCAHRALAGLGISPVPILRGPKGEPQWPAGVIGSITHCAGYRAAVAAWSADILTVGIDAEPNKALPAGVLDQIARPEERDWLDPLLRDGSAARPGGPPHGIPAARSEPLPPGDPAGRPGALPPGGPAVDPVVHWDRLLFSMKESVYKAWFPLARRWLGFEDASITIDPLGGTFSVHLLVDGPVLPGGVPPGRDQPDRALPADLSASLEPQAPERLTGFTGRWLARNGLVITAITVPGR